MSQNLTVTVVEIQPEHLVATTESGERWTIPLSVIAGKPVLNQPLFVHIAAPGNESNAQHPLAQAIIEHLLESTP
jgi:hypothetical protein